MINPLLVFPPSPNVVEKVSTSIGMSKALVRSVRIVSHDSLFCDIVVFLLLLLLWLCVLVVFVLYADPYSFPEELAKQAPFVGILRAEFQKP